MEFGFIYKICCKATGKNYIGQAREFKHKNGKPYNYGIQGRWCDHLSSTKRGASTPIAEAIRQHGVSMFEVEKIEKALLNDLDALEAQWIQKSNTVVPAGYNVCAHSRNRHRTSSSLAKHYKGRVTSAILRPIRRGEEFKMLYAMLTLNTGDVERIAFGQKQTLTYQQARDEALKFLRGLDCPFSEETSNSQVFLERYRTKLLQFEGKELHKIRITSASKLVAVYVSLVGSNSYKNNVRVCFGGKSVSSTDAYELARLFVSALPKQPNTILEDLYQSPQQVAAPGGEASPQEENSVNAFTGSAL